MNFQMSSWAIRQPIPTLVLFLLLAVVGISAFIDLPINANPRVDFPVVTVAVTLPGAASSELENAVTRRVENAIAGLAGIRHMSSTLSDGTSLTTVEFQLGVDPDRATSDVREAVTEVRAELPPAVLEPRISRVDVEGGAILYYAVDSADDHRGVLLLAQLARHLGRSHCATVVDSPYIRRHGVAGLHPEQHHLTGLDIGYRYSGR
ncbi:efflux RND transporter permease subunit [Pseudomonas kulmbachensis]|uniref:efflux RND transporter permease subunit n=1 Tax=Pseudomonas kulmbachensis TaxID=3043408 RepID=UPI003754C80C